MLEKKCMNEYAYPEISQLLVISKKGILIRKSNHSGEKKFTLALFSFKIWKYAIQ